MIALYWLLVAVGTAADLDLAWTHDGWRMAGCTLFVGIVVLLRREIQEAIRV